MKKNFLTLLFTLVASFSLLTACGDNDDPKQPTEKPTSGYFTYYLLTSRETLACMKITTTLRTDHEDKSGEVSVDSCIQVNDVADGMVKMVLKSWANSFPQSDAVVYRVKFSSETAANVQLVYGLHFEAKQMEDSAPNPTLGYGAVISFTPNVGNAVQFNGTFKFSQGVKKDKLTQYAELNSTLNEPKTQRVLLGSN